MEFIPSMKKSFLQHLKAGSFCDFVWAEAGDLVRAMSGDLS
jgi:hypothetical protein